MRSDAGTALQGPITQVKHSGTPFRRTKRRTPDQPPEVATILTSPSSGMPRAPRKQLDALLLRVVSFAPADAMALLAAADTMFPLGLGLAQAKLGPSLIGLDVICKNAMEPCARVLNPQLWSYAHPRFLG